MFKGSVSCRKWTHEGTRRKATGENTTLGSLMREAIADLLAKHAKESEPRRKRSR